MNQKKLLLPLIAMMVISGSVIYGYGDKLLTQVSGPGNGVVNNGGKRLTQVSGPSNVSEPSNKVADIKAFIVLCGPSPIAAPLPYSFVYAKGIGGKGGGAVHCYHGVPGVTVVLKDKNGNVVAQKETVVGGATALSRVIFTGVKAGTYTMEARHPTYGWGKNNVVISSTTVTAKTSVKISPSGSAPQFTSVSDSFYANW